MELTSRGLNDLTKSELIVKYFTTSRALPGAFSTSKPRQTTHCLGRLYPGTPFYGPLILGVGVPSHGHLMGAGLLGWFPISLPNFNLNGKGTMASEAPLALGPAAGHLGSYLTCLHIFRSDLQFLFYEHCTEMHHSRTTLWPPRPCMG